MAKTLPIVGREVPDVAECWGSESHRAPGSARYGALRKFGVEGEYSCPQCDGGHRHAFISCRVLVTTTEGKPRYARTERCSHCGARKCDLPLCIERRNHLGPHLAVDRVLGPIGS